MCFPGNRILETAILQFLLQKCFFHWNKKVLFHRHATLHYLFLELKYFYFLWQRCLVNLGKHLPVELSRKLCRHLFLPWYWNDQAFMPATLSKTKPNTRCFPMKFVNGCSMLCSSSATSYTFSIRKVKKKTETLTITVVA